MKTDPMQAATKGISQSKGGRRESAVGKKRHARTVMKAAAIEQFGPPSVFKVMNLPVPKAGPGEVLIALHAAGVGVWDAEVRAGWWPAGRPAFPLILGTDGAGIVVERGAGVRRFHVGDRVWAYEFVNPKGGFYAEYVAVNSAHVGRVPEGLDLLQAGAGAVTGLTALQAVEDHLGLRRGETILVFGASGAVGTLAVQFAKLREARVLATASGRDAAKLVLRLGADGVIDARSSGAVEQLRALAPGVVDAVLAFAGGETLERCLDLVRPGGTDRVPKRGRAETPSSSYVSDHHLRCTGVSAAFCTARACCSEMSSPGADCRDLSPHRGRKGTRADRAGACPRTHRAADTTRSFLSEKEGKVYY